MSTARIPDGTPLGLARCPDERSVKGKHSVGWFYGTECEWCGQLQPRDPANQPRDPAKFPGKTL